MSEQRLVSAATTDRTYGVYKGLQLSTARPPTRQRSALRLDSKLGTHDDLTKQVDLESRPFSH
jgi:hypothetical protein